MDRDELSFLVLVLVVPSQRPLPITVKGFFFFTEVRFATPLGKLSSFRNDEGQINDGF
jgi:hypothetical protein